MVVIGRALWFFTQFAGHSSPVLLTEIPAGKARG